MHAVIDIALIAVVAFLLLFGDYISDRIRARRESTVNEESAS